MRAILLLFLLWFVALTGYGQQLPGMPANSQGRNCGTSHIMPALLEHQPGMEQRQQEINQVVQEVLRESRQQLRRQQETIVIPVVFHVVYNSEAENISDQQILSQLAILNDDFRRRNSDTVATPASFAPFAADTGIEFCLASIDPQGNPTTGITRTRTSKSTFSSFNNDIMVTSAGGKDIWNRDQYLNIWICNISAIATGQVVGYATPPGSPAAADGVVLHYNTVGAPPFNNFRWVFNLGRTATHEVGHWLGLNHIWGTSSGNSCSDTDRIEDTPNQAGPSSGCPPGIMVSCNNQPYGNMWQNYMDYTDDACMNLFTQGQAAYMQAVLNTVRASILTSPACNGNILTDFEVEIPQDTIIAAGSTVRFTDTSTGTKPTAWYWEFEGGTPATSTEQNPVVTYRSPGKYRVSLTASKGALTNTKTKEQYIHVTVSDVTVFPVPAKDELIIEQQAREAVQQVALLNHIGQVVLQQNVQDRVIRLQISHLSAGVYFLRIQSTNGVTLKKVVVVR